MRKHRLDPFSLVFGATFALIGGLFLFSNTNVEDLHLRWIWPIPLIVLGALIIAVSVRENRTDAEPDDNPRP
ncbi:MAG: hypothetical protein ACRDJ1_05165 [Actinomycetota bacterium]